MKTESLCRLYRNSGERTQIIMKRTLGFIAVGALLLAVVGCGPARAPEKVVETVVVETLLMFVSVSRPMAGQERNQ